MPRFDLNYIVCAFLSSLAFAPFPVMQIGISSSKSIESLAISISVLFP